MVERLVVVVSFDSLSGLCWCVSVLSSWLLILIFWMLCCVLGGVLFVLILWFCM